MCIRDRTKNEATLALAKAIQSKRIVELQNDAHEMCIRDR